MCGNLYLQENTRGSECHPEGPSRGQNLVSDDSVEEPALSAEPEGLCTGAPASSVMPHEGTAILISRMRRWRLGGSL